MSSAPKSPFIDFAETTEYMSHAMMYVAVIGVLASIFMRTPVTPDGSSGPADGAIWGYGTVALALSGALVTALAMSARDSREDSGAVGALFTVWQLITSSSSIMITLAIVVWAITLNAVFYKQINQGFVTPGYETLTHTLGALVAATVLVNFYDLIKRAGASTSTVHSAVVYLLDTFSMLVLVMMNISLLFFSTDG